MIDNIRPKPVSDINENEVNDPRIQRTFVRNQIPDKSLQHSINAVWKYRKRAIGFFLTSMMLIVLGLIFCPRKYSSDAKLFVRIGRASIALDPTVTTGKIMGVETTREAEINSLLEVLSTRTILEKVVDLTKLDAPYSSELARQKAIAKFKDNLTVWSPKRSNVIGIDYLSDSPHKSQLVVDTLVDVFLEEHLRVNSTPGSYEFFEEQTAEIKIQLDTELEKLRDAKNKFGIGSIDGQRQSLQAQFLENQKQISSTDAELNATRAKISEFELMLRDLPNMVVKQFVSGLPADAENNMREQVFNLQIREQELLAKLTNSHPHVIAIQQQVQELKRILGAEQPDRIQASSAVLLKEKATEKSFVAKQNTLILHAKRLQESISTLNHQEVEIVGLERQVALMEVKYNTYVQNLEQARIGRELKKDEITNISVMQPATLLLKPASPQKAITLVLGFLISIVGAIALAIVSNSFSPSGQEKSLVQSAVRNTMSEPLPYNQPILVQ
ncbi:MAG: hypothetical protein COA78_03170 [Blastopirellula sp.]|nr:MAG: hypothetical protein COA78_03170 [Blastopirellula sp.]